MRADELYSEVLTLTEANLGFVKGYVKNPKQAFHCNGSMIPAVVYQVAPGERLIKMNDPVTGGASYARQSFGSSGFGEADWHPTRTSWPDLKMAIATRNNPPDVKYQPAPPVIDLRCPACSFEFQINQDYLPFGGKTTCQQCGSQQDTEAFDAITI